jgi:hypothetical protein
MYFVGAVLQGTHPPVQERPAKSVLIYPSSGLSLTVLQLWTQSP